MYEDVQNFCIKVLFVNVSALVSIEEVLCIKVNIECVERLTFN